MTDRDYFALADETLKHPDGRATGGEPCVQCGGPVPSSAHWKQRDRHVCGTRCNANLMRKFRRGTAVTAERAAAAAAKVASIPNPRMSAESRVFFTTPDARVPFEYEGYGPLPGDGAERYGILTLYRNEDIDLGYWSGQARVAWTAGGNAIVTGTTSEGFSSNLLLGTIIAGQFHGGLPKPFDELGIQCEWRRELVTDLHFDGVRHFRWESYAAVPIAAPPYPPSLESARYRSEMDRRARMSTAASRARSRASGDAAIELFDPHEVFERDEWFCQVCGTEVDPHTRYPDPWCGTLDHRVPLSAGGHHTLDNAQLAHLTCNLAKRDSFI